MTLYCLDFLRSLKGIFESSFDEIHFRAQFMIKTFTDPFNEIPFVRHTSHYPLNVIKYVSKRKQSNEAE